MYFENTMLQTHQLMDGEVSSSGLNIDYGVGIRVLCGEKTGYAYSESTEWADMEVPQKPLPQYLRVRRSSHATPEASERHTRLRKTTEADW